MKDLISAFFFPRFRVLIGLCSKARKRKRGNSMLQNFFDFLGFPYNALSHMVAYGSIWFYELSLTSKEAFLVAVLNFWTKGI